MGSLEQYGLVLQKGLNTMLLCDPQPTTEGTNTLYLMEYSHCELFFHLPEKETFSRAQSHFCTNNHEPKRTCSANEEIKVDSFSFVL